MARPKRTIEQLLIEEALDCAEVYDWEIRADYSGRGMYGEECFGIKFGGNGVGPAFRFFAALGQMSGERSVDNDWNPDDVADLAAAARTDSMGRSSMIVYFPSWSVTA